MAALIHFLCGSAGSGKTRRLLARYQDVLRQSIGAALWLAPTYRAAASVRPCLLEEGRGCLAPQLYTFQDFVEEIIRVNDPSARPLPNLQRRLIADDLVARLHGEGKLSHFQRIVDTRGFAEDVFAFLAVLKQNEIWPEHLNAVVDSSASSDARPSKDRQCALIYTHYQEQLIRHNLYDLEGRFWYARDLLGKGMRQPFAGVRVVFVDGFTDFTRTQCEILEEVSRWVDELWITLPDEPGDERAELFTRPRTTRKRLEALGGQVETTAGNPGSTLPAGLAHLERQLFRPLRAVQPASDADGVECLKAPGQVGEARMVACEIKTLLLAGTPAEEIIVILRDLPPYADLLREVFGDYGIPLDIEGTEPLSRNPAVATLLRSLRLPDEDWPFAGVTALLRSSYFRPGWPESEAAPDLAARAEVLLRLLGEPRSREAYLEAVAKWADRPDPGLEDEQAEESRRQYTHELARLCQPFLQRFFKTWDAAPTKAPLAEHAAWLRRFADDLGIARAAAEDDRDSIALRRFWDELEHWVTLEQRLQPGAESNDLVSAREGGWHALSNAKGVDDVGDAPARPSRWSGRAAQPRASGRDRAAFLRTLHALAAEAGVARTPRGPGRVRVLSAALARTLEAPYVFVMGLGERSFPRLQAPEPFFDETERQAFKQAGLDFPCVSDVLPDEMLLFYQVVTRARRRLVLSYPALDDKGQDLLPSSFLSTLLDCFLPGVVPVHRRQMLLDGYDRDPPLCPAEYRVQLAAGIPYRSLPRTPARSASEGTPAFAGIPARSVSEGSIADASGWYESGPVVSWPLATLAQVARQRFEEREYGTYDGQLQHPAILAALGEQFGPEKVFSPTALEDYIACPFRFLMKHVLRLEPLEEPREEIENTKRGAAFHRALSRLHIQLQTAGAHQPAEDVDGYLRQRLDEAVQEYAARAGSAASKTLWQLEGQRLHRHAARYRPHWQKFLAPWAPLGVQPRPHFFEKGFGMPSTSDGDSAEALVIRAEGIEVRLRGRIDRVDIAELEDGIGFWVIDYKTGRAGHYTGKDLKQFARLQLTLYALAVERILLAGRKARPMGLAYWLVTDTGAKVVLPAHPQRPTAWHEEPQQWHTVRDELEKWVAKLVGRIRQGEFPLKPRFENCTELCDFSQVCRISQSRFIEKTWTLPLPVLP